MRFGGGGKGAALRTVASAIRSILALPLDFAMRAPRKPPLAPIAKVTVALPRWPARGL